LFSKVPGGEPSLLFGFADLLRTLRRIPELNKLSSLGAVLAVILERASRNQDVNSWQGAHHRAVAAGIVIIQEALQVGGACDRSPLIAVAHISWYRSVESVLVFIGIVIPGEAEGS